MLMEENTWRRLGVSAKALKILCVVIEVWEMVMLVLALKPRGAATGNKMGALKTCRSLLKVGIAKEKLVIFSSFALGRPYR